MEKKRGFATLEKARLQEIARKGGQMAHEKGTAHQWTSEEAREAGQKGGETRQKKWREANNA